jgi:ABC-type phosphate/phosphonate transport system substrate-binding protein
MIANARMYSVSPEAAGLWRSLLAAVIEQAGLDIKLLEHSHPEPIDALWLRTDLAGVFMCGLPFSRSLARPEIIAAPIPSPPDFRGLPQYWSEMVVRKDSPFQRIEDTFGGRVALTDPGSQSGCMAALCYLATAGDRFPLYREVIASQVTPLGAMTAVIEGAAEVAPIDAYAYSLLRKFRWDLTSRVRVVGRTARTPIPPLVGSHGGFDRLRAAFLEAHHIASTKVLMDDLLLQRFVVPEPNCYDALRSNAEEAGRFWTEHRFAAAVDPAFAVLLPAAG